MLNTGHQLEIRSIKPGVPQVAAHSTPLCSSFTSHPNRRSTQLPNHQSVRLLSESPGVFRTNRQLRSLKINVCEKKLIDVTFIRYFPSPVPFRTVANSASGAGNELYIYTLATRGTWQKQGKSKPPSRVADFIGFSYAESSAASFQI